MSLSSSSEIYDAIVNTLAELDIKPRTATSAMEQTSEWTMRTSGCSSYQTTRTSTSHEESVPFSTSPITEVRRTRKEIIKSISISNTTKRKMTRPSLQQKQSSKRIHNGDRRTRARSTSKIVNRLRSSKRGYTNKMKGVYNEIIEDILTVANPEVTFQQLSTFDQNRLIDRLMNPVSTSVNDRYWSQTYGSLPPHIAWEQSIESDFQFGSNKNDPMFYDNLYQKNPQFAIKTLRQHILDLQEEPGFLPPLHAKLRQLTQLAS